ncbi:hypothetical protein IJG71_01355 [Candidatus Saccharibacteria bacterium]|nr:hypothetical protein [Candidatus Saccharibacteria bacterium]
MARLISGMRMVGTNKSLGQHWLKNRAILEEIAELVAGSGLVGDSVDYTANSSASLSSAKTEVEACLEIGPGLGTLTSSLLRRFKKVIAVEFDKRLADNLPKSFPGKNLEVINGDILDFDFSLIPRPYVVAGNIPYYITSPIIEKLLTAENLAEKIAIDSEGGSGEDYFRQGDDAVLVRKKSGGSLSWSSSSKRRVYSSAES